MQAEELVEGKSEEEKKIRDYCDLIRGIFKNLGEDGIHEAWTTAGVRAAFAAFSCKSGPFSSKRFPSSLLSD